MAANFVHGGDVATPRFGLGGARRVACSVRNGLADEQREVALEAKVLFCVRQKFFASALGPFSR